ncbi:hypothetical protein T492DRAFT_836494 [Pavlovales sp. CCMP2436]|nr:hypothetical protein T492DRAFT_836494 [Pavlovales sp. CCMP2436]
MPELDLGDDLATQLRPEGRVAYYKQRVTQSERELADVQLWCEKGLASQADVHAAQWEARKRESENTELRKALSDAHMFLWEEREARLRVQAQNDEMRLTELESRRKMQHLLALSNPVTQEVTNFHGQVPDGLTRAPHALAASHPTPGYQATGGGGRANASRGRRASASNAPGRTGAQTARRMDERAPEK